MIKKTKHFKVVKLVKSHSPQNKLLLKNKFGRQSKRFHRKLVYRFGSGSMWGSNE